MYYGYVTSIGYRGWIEKEQRWMTFPTEKEYKEYVDEL